MFPQQQFPQQQFPQQQFPQQPQFQGYAPAQTVGPREYSWKVAVNTITVRSDGESISYRSGLAGGSVPRAMIEAWAVGDRSGDSEGIQPDLSKFLMLGAWGELLLVYRTPSGGRKIERINLDANSKDCQALIQSLLAEMPDRFRGMGPARKLNTALGFSNAGYYFKQVAILTVVLGLLIAGIVYLAMNSGPSQ